MNITFRLTREKADLLDNILRAFGEEKIISTKRVLKLCRGSEELTIEYITLLVNLNLIKRIGNIEGKILPRRLAKLPNAEDLLLIGGFSEIQKIDEY
ncbi:hypothetical protein ACFOG5_23920 [Pedobacter fastidiosus]|uniref:Uncharacterized protein n=1 Tax=Pedobacter fastidiosus TaxID=2765361 RepID=A0ABR7KWV9_9SPHI|nr:hypothetical protein [Pedobacter fastidiosus]MBC6112602.1 hypothetical protein [Pedobacter fastidiosus]